MTTLKGEKIVPEFLGILENYVATHYGSAATPVARCKNVLRGRFMVAP